MKTTPTLKTWVFQPKPNPQARLRLLCFPYAGGGASIFRTWPAHLPGDVEVWAIRLPGRENRLSETPFTRLPLLIQALTDILHPHLSTPFALFGHSMGTLISFELARRLRQEQLPEPVHLFVSGWRAPQIPNPKPPIYQLPQTRFIEEVRAYNGTPEAVFQEPELMQLMLPILRADFTMAETYEYTPAPPLDCPISAFGGQRDDIVSIDNLNAWRVQTNGRFTSRIYPGGHFFLRQAQIPMLQAIGHDLAII